MNRVLIHYNNKKESIEVKRKLERILGEKKITITEMQPDLVVVIGGDGTMLSAIRQYRALEKPFIGINTGTLGFLPTMLPNELSKFADLLERGSFHIESYPLLKAKAKTITGEIIEDYAFNEILVKHLEPKLMEVKLYVNRKPFNYFTGDGFIISTPIGATGYGIWAGGVATHSALKVYQLIPLHPNDNSINRPLKIPMIVPLDTVMKFDIIKSEKREVIVACDGIKMSNKYISELDVGVAEISVSIVRMNDFDYFDFFKRKIVDKGDFRTINEDQEF